ncbi:hypothetical protein NFI96_028846, partial [Prochilodus magdalenae]
MKLQQIGGRCFNPDILRSEQLHCLQNIMKPLRFSAHPAAVAYSMTTLGSSMMNSIFSFYYVKLFLNKYRISEAAFHQSQVVYMIWNALNDPLFGYLQDNSNMKCCSLRRLSILYGAPFYGLAFLLTWFPWGDYAPGDWLSGLHLMVTLCAFDGMLTFVLLAQCALFAEISEHHHNRLRLIKYNQVASLLGSSSVLFCGLVSNNMDNFAAFQGFCFVVALLGCACMVYTGLYSEGRFDRKCSDADSEQPVLSFSSVLTMTWQIITNRDFQLFVVMNFFQVFMLAFCNNFAMIFVEHLIPADVLPSLAKSIMYGAGFICPQLLVLGSQNLLHMFGYYRLILVTFYVEAAAAAVMLLLGPNSYYCLALFITGNMILVQAAFSLFSLPLADIIDSDLQKYQRSSPLSSMVFGTNALFTKPAQSLAPMLVVSILNQYGYEDIKDGKITDPSSFEIQGKCVMDQLNQLNVMRLQEPLPTALDLSMGCRQIPVKASSVEALDLVKVHRSDCNSGTNSRTLGVQGNHISKPFKQGAPHSSQSDAPSRFGYESVYCGMHKQTSLPLLDGLPPIAQVLCPCPPISPEPIEDGITDVQMDEAFMHPSGTPFERLIAVSQNATPETGSPVRTRGRAKERKSALNAESQYSKAACSGKSALPRTRSKGFLVPQDSASPTPSLHSTSSVSVISEDSALVLVRKQTTVETLSSECTFSDVNSPCTVEYVSSDDSDVIEVPITRCVKNAYCANELAFHNVAETLQSSEVSSPTADSDPETDAFVSQSLPSTSNSENANVHKASQDEASPLPSLKDGTTSQRKAPSKRKRRTNLQPKQKSRGKKRTNVSTGSKAAATKRRRKKPGPSKSSTSMFPPEEPEIMLKYTNNKDEKREAKGDNFAPYIRMEFSTCTVVNFQNDDGDTKAKKSSLSTASSGTVPKTSCSLLGRLSSDSRSQVGQLCCLCGRIANAIGMGDLHGPYSPCGPQPDTYYSPIVVNHDTELAQGLEDRKPDRLVDCEEDKSAVLRKEHCLSDEWPGPSERDSRERWVHEDCAIWSAGVFLVKGKLYGLEEAVRLAQETRPVVAPAAPYSSCNDNDLLMIHSKDTDAVTGTDPIKDDRLYFRQTELKGYQNCPPVRAVFELV